MCRCSCASSEAAALAEIPYRLGDIAGWLGWRPPIRSNARLEIARGATGDPQPWIALTGIRPRSLSEALAATPPSIQERWFAQLYFTKFAVFATLVLFWVGTGVVSLGPGFEVGMQYMRAAGVEHVAPIGIVVGAIADIVIGLGIAFRRSCRIALYGALVISTFYAVAGTIHFDNYEGRWGDPVHINTFKHAYSIEKLKIAARQKGQTMTEATAKDGSIVLTIKES